MYLFVICPYLEVPDVVSVITPICMQILAPIAFVVVECYSC